MSGKDNHGFDVEILEVIREVLKEIKESQKDMQSDIADIKQDVGVHILRTNILQEEQKEHREKIEQLQKDAWKAKGALAFLGLILTIVSIFAMIPKH